MSGGFLPSDRARRSQTPLSVHSSEKDRETAVPPLVTQLSGISLEQNQMNVKQSPVLEVRNCSFSHLHSLLYLCLSIGAIIVLMLLPEDLEDVKMARSVVSCLARTCCQY